MLNSKCAHGTSVQCEAYCTLREESRWNRVTLKPSPEGVSCPALRGREVYRAAFSFLGAAKALLGSCGRTQCSIRARSYSESLRWTCRVSWEKSEYGLLASHRCCSALQSVPPHHRYGPFSRGTRPILSLSPPFYITDMGPSQEALAQF